ncbi:MAG: glycine zipper 2TM domain-containing protein, partial [Novosphingobium sp.]
MRLRALAGTAALAAAVTALSAAPALAHDHGNTFPPPPPGAYSAPMGGGWQGQTGGDFGVQRDHWLAECRHRLSDNGVGGAIIGGVVGGIAGHEIAGRHDRALGTVAGAVVGAVAGAAIDKAEDRGRVRDRCDDMLEGYSG